MNRTTDKFKKQAGTQKRLECNNEVTRVGLFKSWIQKGPLEIQADVHFWLLTYAIWHARTLGQP